MAPNRRLKQARELRGWSQAKVAEEIGTDATTVSRWERGVFSPTPYFRERLCKLFGKNAEELGLLESAYALPESEQSRAFFQSSTAVPSFQASGAWPREEVYAGNIVVPMPPSWAKRTDTFSYIMHSAAHDQQAHLLWGDAYVRALHGQPAEAQRLGEASLSAFEQVGHLNAAAIREWLNQRDLTSPPSSTAEAPTAPLPILPDQHQKADRRLLHGKGTGIVLILVLIAALVFAGFSFAQVYQTATASSRATKAAAQANSLAELMSNPTPTQVLPSPSPSTPALTLRAKIDPDRLTLRNCFPDSLGYRCDLHLWLFVSGRQGSFTWQISSASTLALVHSPLQGNGTSGSWTQITVYIQPEREGQQLIFTFFFASYTSTAAAVWES